MHNLTPPAFQAPDLSGLLQSYRPPGGCYDELLDSNGEVRPHWHELLTGLHALSDLERHQAMDHSRGLLLDNDVTYQPQGPAGAPRPWQLDLLPFVIAPGEFSNLQAGLAQRARLLDAIVADCLGPQHLLAEGRLPPAIVYGHNSFLPACHSARRPPGKHLHLMGFDLARAPNGQWWVVRNRISIPSGLGYALEARIIASQCLPGLFEQGSVMRVSRFFRTFSNSLHALSGHDNPLNLVLTAHQRNDDYFEHAFLGRYLGQGVVAGGDLTVRDDRVYLKTIRGLQPVDLLVRRIDTSDCDPLELRFESTDGVPGLMQAVRGGKVTMANAPGSEIADDPSLNSFLPGLCEHLLGESLLIPSVASWWCGQPEERQYVMDNLRGLVMRRLHTGTTRPDRLRSQYVGAQLSGDEVDELARLIGQFPSEFVGREPMDVAVAPAWNRAGDIVAAATTVRLYLTASDDGYFLMPGGLARADASEPEVREPMRMPNVLNKDIWVASTDSGDTMPAASLLHESIELQRSDRNLASRTADNLFWLGSYMERAENATRLLRTLLQHVSGESVLGQQVAALDSLAAVLVAQGQLSAKRARHLLAQGKRSFAFELSSIIFDPESDDSLSQVLGNIARTADLVRERLSPDMWRQLERLTHINSGPGTSETTHDVFGALNYLNTMLDAMAAINGMIALNMTRADGWRFLDSGRRVERIRQMARLFNELTAKPAAIEQGTLNLLLEVSDCAITYRTRYGASPQFAAAADLILADDTHPRSLLTQVVALRALLDAMPDIDDRGMTGQAEKALLRLESSLRLLDVNELDTKRSQAGARTEVTRMCRRALADANIIIQQLTAHYFSHVTQSRVSGQFASPEPR